jgi:hypothetical protein
LAHGFSLWLVGPLALRPVARQYTTEEDAHLKEAVKQKGRGWGSSVSFKCTSPTTWVPPTRPHHLPTAPS